MSAVKALQKIYLNLPIVTVGVRNVGLKIYYIELKKPFALLYYALFH